MGRAAIRKARRRDARASVFWEAVVLIFGLAVLVGLICTAMSFTLIQLINFVSEEVHYYLYGK
jgi:hypothetical protein